VSVAEILVLLVGLAVIIFLILVFVGVVAGARRDPKITGPALTGTAQVLSVEDTLARRGDASGQKWYTYLVGLRVEIPGREPYDATVRQLFTMAGIAALQVGRTVPVQVEAANPLNVRVDFGKKITWPATESPASTPTVAEIADAYKHVPGGSRHYQSAADLLASGQRVGGVLKSFADTGETARSLGRTPSGPELLDAPRYILEVELQFPNLAPVQARNVQPVPLAQVPNLAIGRELTCAVDPADPSHRFAVDWAAKAP
jgi:hypothetical protein